jgi:hypothetical protein
MGSCWGPSEDGNSYDFDLPAMQPRGVGITHGIVFVDFLESVIREKTIMWADCQSAQGELRWLLYLLFSTTPTDEWFTVLKEYGFSEELMMSWAYLVANRVFSRWEFNDSENLEQLAEIYRKALPQYDSFICLSLMSHIVDEEYSNDKVNNPLNPIFLKQALKIISNYDAEKIDEGFLLKTQKWEYWSSQVWGKEKKPKQSVDLLAAFKKSLNKFSKTAVIEKEVPIKQTIKFVEHLKKHRESLRNEAN